ncbi:MAG: DUF4185 domain-containing protein [Candidatus Acidiferrales bacterium]
MKRNWAIGALLVGLLSLPCVACAQSPNNSAPNPNLVGPSANGFEVIPAVSLVNPGFSNERCRVTNDAYSGINNLSNQFDMGGADQGISVDDPFHHVTWVFFGDSAAVDGDAWYGSQGANTQGYLNGRSYGNPLGLCGSLQLVTQPGLVSGNINPATGQHQKVYAPDLLTAPPGDVISNYLFHSPIAPLKLPDNLTVLPEFSPSVSGISGTNESMSGAFAYKENIYLFYFGSPGRDINIDCSIGLPKGSVSFLTVWKNPLEVQPWDPWRINPQNSSPKPTDYNILSRVDYNLDNFTYNGCLYSDGSSACTPPWPTGAAAPHNCTAAHPPTGYTPPTAPGDWQSPSPSAGPLGGNFIWIDPVVGNDGYLYLFGTGTFRASFLYLARMPLSYRGQDFPNFVTPYFSDTPGLEFYNSTTGKWALNDPSNATPLVFGDDPNPDFGQISVRYFDNIGVWLLMYTHATGGGNGAEVVVRWSTSPTGKWSDMLIALDLTSTTPAGQQNQSLYGCSDMSCEDAPPTEQQAPFTDFSAADVYAPDMLPYLTKVSPVFGAYGVPTGFNFTVSYLLSSFKPYDSVLFDVDMRIQYQFHETDWP